MIHREYEWKGIDGTRLYGQSWFPENSARAVVNYVHGFKDYGGRFERWAHRLVENQYGVIAIDLRGHGHSDGRRGYAPRYKYLIKDVSVLRKKAEELFPDLKHILYGHSLGGNLVANYLMTESQQPDAAVIASPWFTLAISPSWLKILMAHTLKVIMPKMLVSSDLEAEYLSHDPEVVEKYQADPLVHHTILPKLFLEIELYGIKASTSIYKINVPVLVMHGTDDHITSFRQTSQFVQNAGKRTTFREWPGGYHELHNETFEKEVFGYFLSWLNEQTGKS
jgi:alpha-beta hydrolase superfamily lysophospholipase